MTKLAKKLGFMDIFAIASGAMISSGLFILIGVAYRSAGPAVIISYLLAGLLFLPAVLSTIELATAMPKAGGTYFYIDRSMGPLMGTLGGTASWLALTLKSAFAIVGIGALTSFFFPSLGDIQIKILLVVLVLFFMVLNILGVKEASRMQVILVLGLFSVLGYFVLRGVYHVQASHFQVFIPNGYLPVLSASGMIFIAFGGMSKAASVAEETTDPARNIPMGILVAFGLTMMLYIAVVFVVVGVLPENILSVSFNAVSTTARQIEGSTGFRLTALAELIAFVTTANAGVMAASRAPMAMSLDGHLPSFFRKIHPKFKTPINSVLVTGVSMMILILSLNLEDLAKTASVIFMIMLTLTILSLIVMRESNIFSYKPTFRSPGYPYVHAIGIIGYIALIANLGLKPFLISTGILVGAAIWYMVYSRIQSNRDSAIFHLVKHMTRGEFSGPVTTESLADEIRRIVHERDEIIEDRFDHVVKECRVLDLDQPMKLIEFYRYISNIIAKDIDLDSEELLKQFLRRESEGMSSVYPGISMPHVLLPEKEIPFTMVIVRSKPGICYGENCPPVKTSFVIVAPQKERSFFLNSMMAVADITRYDEFESEWMKANNEDQLRSIILAAERRRMQNLYCRYHPPGVTPSDIEDFDYRRLE
jgi:basic amino acid/polyamine antiporter, APA family